MPCAKYLPRWGERSPTTAGGDNGNAQATKSSQAKWSKRENKTMGKENRTGTERNTSAKGSYEVPEKAARAIEASRRPQSSRTLAPLPEPLCKHAHSGPGKSLTLFPLLAPDVPGRNRPAVHGDTMTLFCELLLDKTLLHTHVMCVYRG